uniref:Uncharacterized protein n=1 Tax=Tetraselmis sp. GSL018 TaxID=582737 RepID=A0A061SH43_9CHLO|mmetsp:Transcript_31065/g.73846  ORF Transcript_31065/g.73846 Transcript_31065/m.73846 type:complete len:491 (-) Transcript_31065:223-1695(-)
MHLLKALDTVKSSKPLGETSRRPFFLVSSQTRNSIVKRPSQTSKASNVSNLRYFSGPSVKPLFALRKGNSCAKSELPVAALLDAWRRKSDDAIPLDPESQLSPSERKVLQGKRFWALWPALPIAPYSSRKTVLREIFPGKMYALEQTQGLLNVIVNVRMVVVVLRGGGLWVHNPLAPTAELLEMMAGLEERHGAVRYIVLGSTQVEHKVFLGPFARAFPKAQVHAVPTQWSWPVNLPLTLLGLFPRRLAGIVSDSFEGGQFPGGKSPWANEFEQAVLSVPLRVGQFTEAAFFHKDTRTVILTDALQCVPEEPPEVCPRESLLIRARDGPGLELADSLGTRRQGWAKIVLFALYFKPKVVKPAIYRDGPIPNVVDGFEWDPKWKSSFASIARKLFVPPILHVLIFNRSPEAVAAWGEVIASWRPRAVLPAHLDGPVKASGPAIRRAFRATLSPRAGPYLPGDIEALESVDEGLLARGLTLQTRVDNRVNRF